MLSEVKCFLEEYNVREKLRYCNSRNKNLWNIRKEAGNKNLIGINSDYLNQNNKVNMRKLGEIYELCGEYDINSREIFGIGHANIVDKYGSEYQKKLIMPSIASGNLLVGIGLTEKSCGSDLNKINCSVKKTKDGYIINGEKSFVSRIDEADYFLVFTRSIEKKYSKNNLSCFLVKMDSEGIEKYNYNPMGLQGWSYGGFKLKNVHVKENALIGKDCEAFEYFLDHFSHWRILMTLLTLGNAKYNIKEAIKYSSERKSSRKYLYEHQSVLHKISENTTKIKLAKEFCLLQLERYDRGKSIHKESAMAKWFGTETSYNAINDCMQIFGARGYCEEYNIENHLKNARGFMIADGSNDTLKSYIGNELIKDYLKKEVYNAKKL
ncbi:acyl-CoA dehydrogenase family protein [Mammaliicoccus sciuri]|uniref:acyl-CoA dehydrogenase family protein n=1 Tax=Mammaliicoccus sciuri TaxID=1296 RepID=UPI003F552306